jgi:hypothetical protein
MSSGDFDLRTQLREMRKELRQGWRNMQADWWPVGFLVSLPVIILFGFLVVIGLSAGG